MRRLLIAFILSVTLPLAVLAQGPIFVAPPNTMPAHYLGPSVSFSRRSQQTDLNFQTSYGVRAGFTLGLGTTMIMEGSGPLQLARLQAQARLRLLDRVGDGVRTVVGMGVGYALPLGASVRQVAEDNGLSRFSGGATAAHVNRRTGYFGGILYTRDSHPGRDRSTGTAGVAFSWRPKPALPGATGGPGLTLFGETLGHYETNHSGWIAVAPGFLYRVGRAQFKVGVRIPVGRWNSNSRILLSVGTILFVPV